jgi:hypothetical protein
MAFQHNHAADMTYRDHRDHNQWDVSNGLESDADGSIVSFYR